MPHHLINTSTRTPRLAIHGGQFRPGTREIAAETAIALVYNGVPHAVLMATPADLEDLALGFSLTEGIIKSPAGLTSIEIAPQPGGVELRIRLALGRARSDRGRAIVGSTGCGLCGVATLAEAVRPPPPVHSDLTISATELAAAMAQMRQHQHLGRATAAVHAAALWTHKDGLALLREDVGRHNALDKLAGAIARHPIDPTQGVILLTSRVSVEMVQKTARIGAPIIAAISAPTSLAIATAEACGITLAAIVRDDGFELFTAPHRIVHQSRVAATAPAAPPPALPPGPSRPAPASRHPQ